MTNWLLHDFARLTLERRAIDKLHQSVDWLDATWRLSKKFEAIVDINITVHGRIYEGYMTYPALYPVTPPYIRPRDATELWTLHQYGSGGSLCLQLRTDNWRSEFTGADVIQSAYDLLAAEQHPERPVTVPSDHSVTPGQVLRSSGDRFVCTADLLRNIASIESGHTADLEIYSIFHRTWNGFSSTRFASSITLQKSGQKNDPHVISDLPVGMRRYVPLSGYQTEGRVFRSDVLKGASGATTASQLLDLLRVRGFPDASLIMTKDDPPVYKDQLVVLAGATPADFHSYWINPGVEGTLELQANIQAERKSARTPDEGLDGLRVGVVGLGSIGSKVVTSLARSGIKNFLLVDDDSLRPENVCRHDLNWSSVGMQKTDMMDEALSLLGPDIAVSKHITRLAGQESPLAAAAALKDLSTCNVIVDATADPDAFLLLAEVARQGKVPLCWGLVFAGGYGGLIARARPDGEAPPLVVRDAVSQYCDQFPDAPFQNAVNYDGSPEEPAIAYDSDVGLIAAALTRLVLDTCAKRSPTTFPHPAYLIGLRQEWVFTEVFDIRPIDVPPSEWHPKASEMSAEEKIKGEEFLDTLIADLINDKPEDTAGTG